MVGVEIYLRATWQHLWLKGRMIVINENEGNLKIHPDFWFDKLYVSNGYVGN